jgi:small-conductance mechanosensitive channel
VLKDPVPEVHLTELADSSVEFTLIARAADYTKKFAAENILRERTYLAFAKAGIEIPFPQRVVHTKIET